MGLEPKARAVARIATPVFAAGPIKTGGPAVSKACFYDPRRLHRIFLILSTPRSLMTRCNKVRLSASMPVPSKHEISNTDTL